MTRAVRLSRPFAIALSVLTALLLLLVSTPVARADSPASQTTDIAAAAPQPGDGSQYAGAVSLIALGGLVVFGVRRFTVARSRRT